MHALITGANGGLGSALVDRLLASGWLVTALVRGGTARFPARPGLRVLDVDLSTYDGRPLVTGPLDGLVCIAGSSVVGPVSDVPAHDLQALLALNAVAPYRLVQAHLPQLVAARGTVVQTSTLAAAVPLPFYGVYAASKLAVEGWSDALRLEVGALGVRVYCVQPGSYATGVQQRLRFVALQRLPALAPLYDRFQRLVRGRGFDGAAAPAHFAAHVAGLLEGAGGPFRQPIGPGAWTAYAPSWLRDVVLGLGIRYASRRPSRADAATGRAPAPASSSASNTR